MAFAVTNTFTNGTVANATEVNTNYTEIEQNINSTHATYNAAPIGSVISWLKSYTNTPSLPAGWVECNGQTLTDSDSVYNGQVIPDLNGDDRFLYGAASSGSTKTEDYLPSHNHNLTCVGNPITDGVDVASGGTSTNTTWIVSKTSGTAWSAYSVVWIIRVK